MRRADPIRHFALQGHDHRFENTGWDDVHVRPRETDPVRYPNAEMCGSDPSFAEAMDSDLADAA